MGVSCDAWAERLLTVGPGSIPAAGASLFELIPYVVIKNLQNSLSFD